MLASTAHRVYPRLTRVVAGLCSLQAQRDQLDTWYNTLVARRRGKAGGVGAGGGIIAPSGVTETAARGAVGVWHPLFNRSIRK